MDNSNPKNPYNPPNAGVGQYEANSSTKEPLPTYNDSQAMAGGSNQYYNPPGQYSTPPGQYNSPPPPPAGAYYPPTGGYPPPPPQNLNGNPPPPPPQSYGQQAMGRLPNVRQWSRRRQILGAACCLLWIFIIIIALAYPLTRRNYYCNFDTDCISHFGTGWVCYRNRCET